ncbi:MAG: hypothetical protein M0Z32_02730 [Actinomycetota bacterium]|nr:hypothetical protein [Actinomycetota bacterium]MDA8166653.1 hypothetical protein [Actinomycetota bacterium]
MDRSERFSRFNGTGPAKLAALRDAGSDPTHGGKAAEKRGKVVAARHKANAAWEKDNERLDPAMFTQEILPLIKDIPLGQLERATGLSKSYCSLIRQGLKGRILGIGKSCVGLVRTHEFAAC